MPRDYKKITLDDILVEYEHREDISVGKENVSVAAPADVSSSEDVEFSEEISIDGDENFDDVEIVEEPFAVPEPDHTWQEIGADDLPIISDTYDGKAGSDIAVPGSGAMQYKDVGRSGGFSRIEQINADRKAKQNGTYDKIKSVSTSDDMKYAVSDGKTKSISVDGKVKNAGADGKSKSIGVDGKAKKVSVNAESVKLKPDSGVSAGIREKSVSQKSMADADSADFENGKTKSDGIQDKNKVSPVRKQEQNNGIAGTAAESDEKSEPGSVIQAMEASEDVNDRWLARFVKSVFPVKGDSALEVIRKIIFLIAVIVFIGAGVMLISTLVQSKEAIDIQQTFQSIIVTTVATTVDEEGNTYTIPPTSEEISQHISEVAEVISEFNEDYVGYLEIPGCNIYEPVVQGDDNDKYLRTNIYGNYNKAGTIFMDYRCSLTNEYTSPNIVIYGHNQEDGTMFGRLKLYKYDLSFYQRNPYVRFSTDTEISQYLVYGFFVTNASENQDNDGVVFHYHDYIDEINDENVFDWYIGEIQARNQIISPVDVRYGDELLCLSTCSSDFTDSRFVVFARKLRAGESIYDYDFSISRLNPNAKGVDWEAVLSGETLESMDNLPDDELSEIVTSEKSIGKRNVRTEAAGSETEFSPEEVSETAVTTVPAEREEVPETVIPSESSDTGSVTASDKNVSETDSDTDGGTESDSSDDETVETTARKKTNKTNSTSPV